MLRNHWGVLLKCRIGFRRGPAWDSAFLTCSQEMLMLLVEGPYLIPLSSWNISFSFTPSALAQFILWYFYTFIPCFIIVSYVHILLGFPKKRLWHTQEIGSWFLFSFFIFWNKSNQQNIGHIVDIQYLLIVKCFPGKYNNHLLSLSGFMNRLCQLFKNHFTANQPFHHIRQRK